MSCLILYILLGFGTWVSLVADGRHRLWPRAFWRTLLRQTYLYGYPRILLWMLVCLTGWWLIWLAWAAEGLHRRQ